ncbi:hypothetical protein BGZ73_001367 [Actinomortierella ambigua]|nr:hypothetical protein BGZ73_001367 [Actinomortierella ambigua]
MPNVLIVGAGIAGLSLAIFLERAGVPYLVLERVQEFKPLGSSMVLSPQVLRVFDQLGILPELEKISGVCVCGVYMNQKQNVLGRIDVTFLEERYGYPNLVFSRPDIMNVLLRHVPKEKILWGKRVLSLLQNPEGAMVRCADGTTIHCNIVVGADGAYSAVRQALYDSMKKKNIRLPENDTAPLRFDQFSILGVTERVDHIYKFPGEGCRMYNIFPSNPDQVYVHTIPYDDGRVAWRLSGPSLSKYLKSEASFRCTDWDTESIDNLKKHLNDAPAYIVGTIGKLFEHTKVISRIMVEDKFYENWYHGRTVLIGDANLIVELPSSHPDDIERMFATYYSIRAPQARKAVAGSKTLAKIISADTSVGIVVRSVVLKLLSGPLNIRSMDGMYSGRPLLNYLPPIPLKGSLPNNAKPMTLSSKNETKKSRHAHATILVREPVYWYPNVPVLITTLVINNDLSAASDVWSNVSTPNAKQVENADNLDAWQETVGKHVHWVRHVFGDELSGVLCKLAAILLKHSRDLKSMHIWVRDKADIVLWIQLIELNPRLQVIEFPTMSKPVSDMERSRLVEALSCHGRLRRFELACAVPLSFLYQLLETCSSLLELSVHHVVNSMDVQQDAQAEGRQHSEEISRTFALRRLDVYAYFARPAVAELLLRTPTLESLGLINIGIGYCDIVARVIQEGRLPMLSELTLKPSRVLGALERLTHAMEPLMRAIPPQQLQSIKFDTLGDVPMDNLLSVHGQFLEWIRFAHFPGHSALTSVFFECPRLKELVVENHLSGDFVEIRDLLFEPWVCKDLEILSVPIGVDRWLNPSLPPEMIKAMAKDQPVNCPQWKQAEALFMSRFRQLKKLRYVDISNVSPRLALSYAVQVEARTKTLVEPD